jgi:hypothetical protein
LFVLFLCKCTTTVREDFSYELVALKGASYRNALDTLVSINDTVMKQVLFGYDTVPTVRWGVLGWGFSPSSFTTVGKIDTLAFAYDSSRIIGYCFDPLTGAKTFDYSNSLRAIMQGIPFDSTLGLVATGSNASITSKGGFRFDLRSSCGEAKGEFYYIEVEGYKFVKKMKDFSLGGGMVIP